MLTQTGKYPGFWLKSRPSPESINNIVVYYYCVLYSLYCSIILQYILRSSFDWVLQAVKAHDSMVLNCVETHCTTFGWNFLLGTNLVFNKSHYEVMTSTSEFITFSEYRGTISRKKPLARKLPPRPPFRLLRAAGGTPQPGKPSWRAGGSQQPRCRPEPGTAL